MEKVYNSNPDFRKHIVVTADGLPYKVMIELIRNVHTCAVCGKTCPYNRFKQAHETNTACRIFSDLWKYIA